MYLEVYDEGGNFLKKVPAGTRKGVNMVRIPTMMDPPRVPKSPNILGEAVVGPDYPAGKYTVRLVKGTETYTTDLVINDSPDWNHPQADRKLQDGSARNPNGSKSSSRQSSGTRMPGSSRHCRVTRTTSWMYASCMAIRLGISTFRMKGTNRRGCRL